MDVELPAVGTPLYSACLAQTVDCVMLLLHSGRRLTAVIQVWVHAGKEVITPIIKVLRVISLVVIMKIQEGL